MRGSEAQAFAHIDATLRDAPLRGEGLRISAAEWANAVLNNSLGHYEKALAASQRASESSGEMGYASFALAELVEAAARSGKRATAAGAHRPARRAGRRERQRLGARSGGTLARAPD
jgi:hypothetical protein